jgi:hypothetical protein
LSDAAFDYEEARLLGQEEGMDLLIILKTALDLLDGAYALYSKTTRYGFATSITGRSND